MKKLAFLIITLFCASASAQKVNTDWYAKSADGITFHIGTAAELAGLAALVNNMAGAGQPESFAGKTIVLTKNIDISAYGSNFNGGRGWIPIGMDSNYPFRGTFDGNGKTISGLYMNFIWKYAGLFGYVDSTGTVANVGVVNANIVRPAEKAQPIEKDDELRQGAQTAANLLGYGLHWKIAVGLYDYANKEMSEKEAKNAALSSMAGIVAAYTRAGSTLSNCHTTGKISGAGTTGGVAGNVNGSMSGCYSTASVTGRGKDAGGIAGRLKNTMSNCYFNGTVNGDDGAGGVVGAVLENGAVTYCYSTGTVSGSFAGGVAGRVSDGGSVAYSYSKGTVSGGGEGAGGVAGRVSSSGSVLNCYSAGKVSGGTGGSGGVVGNSYGRVANCYSIASVDGKTDVGGVAGALARSSTVENCAALNPSVKAASTGSSSSLGRVIGGYINSETQGQSSGNAGFNEMRNSSGSAIWIEKGANTRNGEDINAATVNIDGTLGGRFASGWTVQDGRLPGIGETVAVPSHLTAAAEDMEAERVRVEAEREQARLAEEARREAEREQARLAEEARKQEILEAEREAERQIELEQQALERERERQKQEAEKAQRDRRKKGVALGTAIGFDLAGAGLVVYGLIEDSNVKKQVDDNKNRTLADRDLTKAENAQTTRNAAYMIGGALLAAGLSIHIIF